MNNQRGEAYGRVQPVVREGVEPMFQTFAVRGSGFARASVLACVAVAGAVAVPVAGDDWNVGPGGNPNRDGRSTEIGPAAATILWQGGQPAVIAQQAVIEGNVVVTARIFNLSNTQGGTNLVAQNLTTGAELWSRQLPVDFPATDWRSRVSAIRDGRVYATRAGNDNASYMYALNVADGSILWRSESLVTEASTEGATFAPDGDLITTGSTVLQRLVRINSTDGLTVWDVARISPTSNGSDAAVFGERVYVWEASVGGPRIAAHDLATGARLYAGDPIGGGFVQQLAPFVGPDGTVYAPRTQNNPITDFLVAFQDSGTSLSERWRTPLGYVPFATFGVGPDGSVYSYTTARPQPSEAELVVHRLDPGTGMILNSSERILANFPAVPRMAIGQDGKVYLTNGSFSRGRVLSFNADLSERWSAPIANVNVGGPAIGQGGVLIVCGVGTDVRAYRSPVCRPDLNGDGSVTVQDFLAFLGLYSAGDARADFTGDGLVNVSDFLAFLTEFAAGC